MLIAAIFPRMKERNHLLRFRINCGKIRPLIQVAIIAGQRQIARFRWSAVLPSDNVLDVKTIMRLGVLMKAAILAIVLRAVPNERPQTVVH